MAQHKASPSTYTTTLSGPPYDVFLSFRGADTRKNFTDHLYTALLNAPFVTFRDDQLERGENIWEELKKAIHLSRSSVIVFSRDYTSSDSCLDELVVILERKKTSDHVVFPVYYDIGPSQLTKQAETLSEVPKHQENQSSEKLNIWRAALEEVAGLAANVLKNEADGHEAKFIQKIVTVIQDKLGRVPLSDVQKKLEDKLLFINDYLDDAEGKQLKFPTVKAWLNELKEAVYDTGDLVQEIKTEALRRKMEPESGSSTSKVQDLNSNLPFHAFDSASIYRRAEEFHKKLDSIMERRRDVFGMEATVEYRVSQTTSSTSFLEDSGVFGRDDEKETLIELLLSDDESGNKISVIPIVGMGGIGKTTLARLLYNDDGVEQHFDKKAWASVSEKFDVLRISQQIYESLTEKACKITNLDLLLSKLKEELKGKMIFFVLDDVWNKNYIEWDNLKCLFQFGAPGSKIIVTTRNQDVARMVCTLQAHCLRPLSAVDSRSLFEKHAFKNTGVGPHSHLEKIGGQIVQKCNGLPLAIKSLGGLLCSKLTVGEWESILNSEMWELPQEESGILPSLWLSYLDLPLPLKRCFAYCSLYPKNYEFKTSELVYLWMAEDLLQPTKNRTAEEVGQGYFNDLISRSFFQLSSRSDEYFIMHDLINDLASFVSGEFCFRWDGSDSPNNLRKTRHFSYMLEDHDEADSHDESDSDDAADSEEMFEADSHGMFEALQQAKCLHTFLPLVPSYLSGRVWGKGFYKALPEFQCLRMLKLSRYIIKELPDSINTLKHLKHLDLSWSSIEKLPDTICTLYNLQVLLLSHCLNLTELPANLGRLINLSHLNITWTFLNKLPPNMGNLKDLQMLPEFVVDKHTAGNNLPELKKLQNLRGRLRISGLVHSSGLEAYILRDKKFLKEVYLDWRGRNSSEEGSNTVEEETEEESSEEGYYTVEEETEEESSEEGNNTVEEETEEESSEEGNNTVEEETEEESSEEGNNTVGEEKEEEESSEEGNNTVEEREVLEKLQPHLNLKRLTINGYGGKMFPGWSEYYSSSALVSLELVDCVNCISLPPLGQLPSLRYLVIQGLHGVVSIGSEFYYGDGNITTCVNKPFRSLRFLEFISMSGWQEWTYVGGDDVEGGVFPNLVNLVVQECSNLTGRLDSLPSLESLRVTSCPEFECIPEDGFPSKLKSLVLYKCKKLNAKSMQNLNKGLRTLTSLEKLSLDFNCDEKVDCFAEEQEGMFPSTLTELQIDGLNCETIDGAKWFGHLNSLQSLSIWRCPALRCLPDSGLPPSLSNLYIRECPLLKTRCQRETGEDWPKIAYIKHILIDGSVIR